jgi:predicted secreted protein
VLNSCEKQDDYTISVGKIINLELEANWSTGYSWHWENKNEPNIVDTLKREYVEGKKRGSTGKEIWTFIGKNKGKEKIALLYKRASIDSIYDNKKEFIIEVK